MGRALVTRHWLLVPPAVRPRLSAGPVIAVAIVTGIAGGVISAVAGRWLHDKIVLAVVGGVAVGLLTLVLSRPRSKRR